ncbi:MAG: MFS transporter [Haloarculaceae archaeon]
MADDPTVGDAIDRIPTGRYHWGLMVVVGGTWASMSAAILSISFTLPIFIDVWNLSGVAAGVLGSASLVGMMVGNTLGGRYADHAGRKRTITVGIVAFSLSTALTGLAVGLYSAMLFRFLTGVGLGAATVAGASYVTEHLPTAKRGRYVTYLEVLFSVGSLVTVAVAWLLLSKFPTDGTLFGVAAWRVFFAVGGAPVVLALVVSRYLSESPYYLAEQGDLDGARDRLASIARSNGVDPAGFPASLSRVESGGNGTGFSRLFDDDLLRTTLLVTGLWVAINLAYYGIFTWLPTTVENAGYVGDLYRYLLVVAVFQFLGQLSGAYLIDVVGRKWTLGSYMVVGGVATYAFAVAIPGNGAVGDQLLFSVGVFAMGFTLFGAWAVLYAYTSELFPTEVRGSGLGFTGSVGKVAATLGPVLFGSLAQFGYLVALAPVMTLLVVYGLLLLTFGRETSGETLS